MRLLTYPVCSKECADALLWQPDDIFLPCFSGENCEMCGMSAVHQAVLLSGPDVYTQTGISMQGIPVVDFAQYEIR